jgi:hypothetical protein
LGPIETSRAPSSWQDREDRIRRGLPGGRKAWRGPQTDEERAYYNVSFEARANYGFFYIGLVLFLAVMCYELQQELPKVR